jgi:FAD/FMN-containing dehydrogenase
MSSTLTEPATWVQSLRERLTGRLIAPTDPDYEAARTVVAGDVDAHPAAIARVAGAADVATVIAVARDHGLELAVRSGGHDSAGNSTTDGGVVIDLRDMKRLEIDREARTAWAETGLTAGEVVSAAAEQGLVIGFGDTGSVGLGGLTLGGGIGYLVRKHGMTIDNLLAAEIVTADGQHLCVDESAHADLFWAIRGGGGNFGVATRFLFRLHPAEDFVGGILVLPATADVVSGFMAASEAAPEELSTIANVMNCPPMPFVPEEYVGQIVVLAMLGWTGDRAAGERAMEPFRELAPPIADLLKPMPYPEMFAAEEGVGEYRPKATERTFFMDHVDGQAAQAMIDALSASDAPLRAVQLRVLGGAMARVPADATAFAHRKAKIMAIVVSFFEDETDFPARRKWVADLAAALDQGVPGGYVNFIGDEGDAGVRRAYPPATLARLAAAKARYDPSNVFRLNQNVPPAS